MKRRDASMGKPSAAKPLTTDGWVEGEVRKSIRNAYWALEYASRLLMDEAPNDPAWGDVDDAQLGVEALAKKLDIDLTPDI